MSRDKISPINYIYTEREHMDRYKNLEAITESNTQAVKELTVKIDNLTKSTEGLVAAWNTANNIQKFIKWLSGLSLLAGAGVVMWTLAKSGGI